MTRGRINIVFIGGSQDGIEQSIPTNLNNPPPGKIFIELDHYAIKYNEDVAIIKRKSKKLDKDWLYYDVEVYEKLDKKNKRKAGFTYQYLGIQQVKRCVALTQKGVRCLKSAIEGKEYCCQTHEKSKRVSDPFLLS